MLRKLLKRKNFIFGKDGDIRSGLTFLILILNAVILSAQNSETLIVGQVFNKFDHSPLESVSVYFKGTNIHTQTNEEGFFLIRNSGKESVLIFSLIGYDKTEIRVKPGESAGVEILLAKKDNMLKELFVNPGANPADELMKRVVANRKKNNPLSMLKRSDQSVVFLSKKDSRWENNRIYEQFKAGNLSETDTALIVPLFMEETESEQSRNEKQILKKNTFNTSKEVQNIVSGLLRGLDSKLNFYNNSVELLDKAMISPLANIGRTYYRYYLFDSISTGSNKEYLLHFRSKNTKNLAFNGEMRIDSASLALTFINAELPKQTNLNYIHNLRINQTYDRHGSIWLPKDENSTWNLTYELLKGVNDRNAQLLINKSVQFAPPGDSLILTTDSFANTAYSQHELEMRMAAVQQTPFYKTAKYIADAVLTGYIRAGFIDIGQYVDIMRLTKPEGFRMGLPLRTNEKFLKNLMLGGQLMYGFGDKKMKYAAEAQIKLPTSKRLILGAKFFNDYRRIDYDYNNYIWREDPLSTGDENIVSTILSFKMQNRSSLRKEFTAFVFNDWNQNIESKWIYRDVTYLPNELLPLTQGETHFTSLRDRHIAFTTRFSFGESSIEKHFQRLYVKSSRPVIYTTVEAGQFALDNIKGNYAKLSSSLLHRGQNFLGEWRYMIEAGKTLGAAPYPILKTIQGKNGGAYGRMEFAMMNSREYIADSYVNALSEYIFNGILFNNIPLVKQLNLREIVGFKASYGSLSPDNVKILDLPAISSKLTQPYAEASIGFCNLFGFISVQSIWRLTDTQKPGVNKWGLRLNLLFTL